MSHRLAVQVQALAGDLRRDTGGQYLPATLDEVIAVAEQTEGVHLGALITAVQPDHQAAADTLTQVLLAAAEIEPEPGPSIEDRLQQCEPVIAATVAAAAGDAGVAAQLSPVLDQLAKTRDWAALVGVLRRIVDGERGDSLLEGLDDIDTAIASQVLARLTPGPAAPAQEQP